MNAPALTAPVPSLDALAAQINAAHAEAQAASTLAVDRAHDAGDRLLLAKAQVEHGQWLPWLSANCPAVAVRTAQAYMRLAGNWGTLETKYADSAYLSIDAAIKLLAAPKPANLTKKRLPKAPVKTATPVADLPLPAPPRPVAVAVQSDFDAAMVALGQPVALDLSFPPPAPKKPLTPEQESMLELDSKRRKPLGLPFQEPEPSPESLGFVGIAAMLQLDGRFNDLLASALSGTDTLGFQRVLRPIEEIRDLMPEYLKTTEQARTAVDLLEILTQQARLRRAWLEIHPEPARPAMSSKALAAALWL